MTDPIRSRVFVLVTLALCLLTSGSSLHSQDLAHPDLDKVRQDIRELKRSLETVKARESSAERDLQAIQLELEIFTREVELARKAESDLEQKTVETLQRIDGLEKSLAGQKRALSKRVGALYKLGKLSYVRLFLSIEDDANPFEAVTMLSFLASKDSREITRFNETRAELDKNLVEMKDQQAKVAQIRAWVENRQAEIEVKKAEQETLLAKLRSESRRSESQLARLEEKERRLGRLLSLLYERKGSQDLLDTRISEFKGAIQWPIRGKVIERFGRQRSSKFATYTVNNGIKIAAEPGSDVTAVFDGSVIYAQWFKGYGNLVIVDHGERVYSLYGNTRGARVSVGNKVAPGQVITSVSESEEGDGYLYFEIREDNKPANPVAWLR